MVHASIYNGIVFIEGDEPSAKLLGEVNYTSYHSFNSQLKTLDSVKEMLSKKTLELGGNAVVNFKYGQKSYGLLKSLIFWLDDNVKWYGSGTAAILTDEKLNAIIDQIK